MNRNVKKLITTLALGVSLVSCAPGLGEKLRLVEVPLARKNSGLPAFDAGKIRVERFTDARTNEAIAQIDGRPVEAQGDPAFLLQEALEKGLKDKGFSLTLFDPPVSLQGEIRQWIVNVTPQFPASQVDAKALIHLSLSDSSGKVVYSAKYEGRSSLQHPYPRESVISKELSNAMGEAVSEALGDGRLVTKMRELSMGAGGSVARESGSSEH